MSRFRQVHVVKQSMGWVAVCTQIAEHWSMFNIL